MRKRGPYDRATIDAILDEGVLCHVGFVVEGSPIVTPTLYWTVTHFEGLVLTRSAFHHSVNYRSVVIFGRPEEVTDLAERATRLRIFMEGLFPGRWDALRPVKPKELRATRLLRVRADEASAKIRSGPLAASPD